MNCEILYVTRRGRQTPGPRHRAGILSPCWNNSQVGDPVDLGFSMGERKALRPARVSWLKLSVIRREHNSSVLLKGCTTVVNFPQTGKSCFFFFFPLTAMNFWTLFHAFWTTESDIGYKRKKLISAGYQYRYLGEAHRSLNESVCQFLDVHPRAEKKKNKTPA